MDTIVKPKVERLYLSDVAARAHATLVATGKATPEQIADSEARVEDAVEDGDWIDVKRRLNTGEQHDLFAVMSPTLTPGERAELKTNAVMTAKVLAYLIGWSLTDDGAPIPMSENLPDQARLASIRSLDPDVFRDIREAIDWHETQVEQEIQARKNARAGRNKSGSSSPSPDVVAGPITTSVN